LIVCFLSIYFDKIRLIPSTICILKKALIISARSFNVMPELE